MIALLTAGRAQQRNANAKSVNIAPVNWYGIKSAVAEVTIKNAVSDVKDFVVEVYEAGGGRPREALV
jgi:hypothetical protein